MIVVALAFLCLSAVLFTVPPLVARGWTALEDWVHRPEPKILTGGLVALTACIVLVPMAHQGVVTEGVAPNSAEYVNGSLRLI